MEKVIYSRGGGLGIILDSQENEKDFFVEKSFVINGQTIQPGDFTDLFGLYSAPARYVGVLKEDEICMAFCLGSSSNLFETQTFYSCFYWLAEDRVANKYSEGSCRDYRWIGGRWK